VLRELVQRYTRSPDSGYSQDSPTFRSAATSTGCYLGRNTPEEPTEEAVAGNEGFRCQDRGQSSPEVGDPPTARVEE
jgi:hypothetical protein